MSDNETVTITLADLKALEKLAVQEAKLEILVGDFQASRKHTDETIGQIFELLREFPSKVNQCRDELETDIEKIYMTKQDGKLLEQHLASNIRSIKLWIVSSVGGFTAAGVCISWYFKLFPTV